RCNHVLNIGTSYPLSMDIRGSSHVAGPLTGAAYCDIFTCEINTIGETMQPEQMRAARAALNWSLDDLAAASGVHRNTLSNFETRKYDGEPEKLAAVKHTLESAGVIFIEENIEAAGG